MNVDILVYKDGQPLKTVSVTLPVTIGRGKDATFTIKHPLLSRKHCEVFEDRGSVQVRDLASLNGTFVNGSRVDNTSAVDSGSQLKLGAVEMVVKYNGASSEDTIASNHASEGEAFDLGTVDTADTEVMAAASDATESAPAEILDLPDFEVSTPDTPPSEEMLDLGDFEVSATAVVEGLAAQDLPSLTELAGAVDEEPAETAVDTPVPASQPAAADDPWAAPSEKPKVTVDDDADLDAFLKDLG
ncbi:MAG: FHA domain-containing protein [Pirellulaceae bacterium]